MATHKPKMKIKKNDLVQVISGRSEKNGGDKGKQGKVIAVYPETQRVLVEGINRVTKHVRAGQPGSSSGGIEVVEAPIHVSNVMVVDADGTPTRVGSRTDENGKRVRLWPGLRDHFKSGSTEIPFEDMQERMLFAEALETVKCFDEGVLDSVADANIGSIFGWGFAPFQGGALQFINAYGVENFVKRSRELARKYGDRFKPASILVKMAKEGRRFE